MLKNVISCFAFLCFAILHSQESKIQEDLTGVWISENEDTRGLTKCNIIYENGMYVVELWGSCIPQDCYWGKTFSKKTEEGVEAIQVTWDQGFVKREQSIGIKDGKLGISTASEYNDARDSRLDYETFIRKKPKE